MKEVIYKINNKTLKIGIIGLGYVGIPLASEFLKNGFKVSGFDTDEEKINSLKNGSSYINHISSDFLKEHMNINFDVSKDVSMIKNVDVIILCLPTPLDEKNNPNMEYVFGTIKSISPFLVKNQTLILESTTYPGTTSEEIYPMIEKLGFNVGKDFFLVYSPEREDPGNKDFKTNKIPKIVSGHTSNCLYVGSSIYEKIVNEVVQVSSTQTAELTKLLENIHRAVNIGLVNEMKIISDGLGIDIYEVIDAAATKPFGFTPYYPGPGIGGHCIPIDPFYLTWKAKQKGIETQFIELAGTINNQMPLRVADEALNLLKKNNLNQKKSKILILGLAYKKDVDDMRESPSIRIMEELERFVDKVDYSDPYIPNMPKTRRYSSSKQSIEVKKDNLRQYDLVIIATDHSEFNYSLIKESSSMILDTRGVYRSIDSDNIFRA
jgi:UDP-N-acetyl-D-glucosamine dehydrogenase